MDVRFSPEQRALRDSAVQLVDKLGASSVGMLDDRDRAARLDTAVEAAGWRQLREPDATGAPLASGIEACLVAEELGRAQADAAHLGPTLATELRRLAGAPAATARETVVLAPDLLQLATARDGAPPSGSLAVDAQGAAGGLLLVPADGGYTLAAVELADPHPRVDLTRAVAPVDERARVRAVSDQTRVVTHDDLATWTALGLALTSADLVGTMRGALTLGSDYAKQRHQYGNPIGSFQAVQHLLADALVATEGARSVALHAAWAVDALAPSDALASAAVAKAYTSRAARRACEAVIQVHGGIGNTWECFAHVYLRRALLSTDVLGGPGPNLERVLVHHHVGSADGLR